MYIIKDSQNRVVEICDHPVYVRRQANGVTVLADAGTAEAIYSSSTDKFYPTERVGYLCEKHTMTEVDEIPPEVVAGYWFCDDEGFYTTDAARTALAKSRAADTAGIVFVKLAESAQLDDAAITAHPEQFAAWAQDVSYAAGAIRAHGGRLWRCLQAHTSQESWTPADSPSLWKEIGDPTAEFPAWSQPIGAADAYAAGDKVSHNGENWVSDLDANVWEPGVYGWSKSEASA